MAHEFTEFEREPDVEASGRHVGPPRKFTAVGVSEPAPFPNIRCFGCGQTMADINMHVESCSEVSANDLARFREARRRFQANPNQAFEAVQSLLKRSH
jgi:hypothetical protein